MDIPGSSQAAPPGKAGPRPLKALSLGMGEAVQPVDRIPSSFWEGLPTDSHVYLGGLKDLK